MSGSHHPAAQTPNVPRPHLQAAAEAQVAQAGEAGQHDGRRVGEAHAALQAEALERGQSSHALDGWWYGARGGRAGQGRGGWARGGWGRAEREKCGVRLGAGLCSAIHIAQPISCSTWWCWCIPSLHGLSPARWLGALPPSGLASKAPFTTPPRSFREASTHPSPPTPPLVCPYLPTVKSTCMHTIVTTART